MRNLLFGWTDPPAAALLMSRPCPHGVSDLMQVFMHYGDRSNAEFVIHQGFFSGEHDNDETTVKLGLAKADPLCKQKSALLSALSVPL